MIDRVLEQPHTVREGVAQTLDFRCPVVPGNRHRGDVPAGATQPAIRTASGIAMDRVPGGLRGWVALHDSPAASAGFASAGAVLSLLDELVTAALMPLGLVADHCGIDVDYIRPVPLDTPIALSAWVSHRDGRRVYTAASMHVERRVVAQGHGRHRVRPANPNDAVISQTTNAPVRPRA